MASKFSLVLLLVTLTGAMAVPPAFCGDLSAEALQSLVGSIVLIRTERVVRYNSYATTGTGFFIHPDGYVLTSWRVVADLMETTVDGKRRDVSAKVTRLAVVIDSGSPKDREVPAVVVARDQKRDLALLKAEWNPRAFVDPLQLGDVAQADRVVTVGYPSGEPQAATQLSETYEGSPAISTSGGTVASLRNDSQGAVACFGIDSAVDLRWPGGPVVDTQGRLVGVIASMTADRQGANAAVSSGVVLDFMAYQAVAVSVAPGAVLEPPQPMKVEVSPVLLEAGSFGGSVRLEGADIDPVTVPLIAVASRLEATIALPQRIFGRQRPTSYALKVTITPDGGRPELVRSIPLDAVPESMMAGHRGQTTQGSQVSVGEVWFPEFKDTRPTPLPVADRKALADYARSATVQKDSGGNLVIDNQKVEDLGGEDPNPEHYRFIRDPLLRQKLERYDRLIILKKRLYEGQFSSTGTSGSDPTYETREAEILDELGKLYRQLDKVGVYQCPDGAYYIARDGEGRATKWLPPPCAGGRDIDY